MLRTERLWHVQRVPSIAELRHSKAFRTASLHQGRIFMQDTGVTRYALPDGFGATAPQVAHRFTNTETAVMVNPQFSAAARSACRGMASRGFTWLRRRKFECESVRRSVRRSEFHTRAVEYVAQTCFDGSHDLQLAIDERRYTCLNFSVESGQRGGFVGRPSVSFCKMPGNCADSASTDLARDWVRSISVSPVSPVVEPLSDSGAARASPSRRP